LHVLVVAKAPVPGRVKTRLSPPLSPVEAAAVAEASLADTLEAVASSGAHRRVLALDGAPGPWLPPGFDIVPQRGHGLAQRLAAAWHDAGGPGVQIGMDTPQVSAELLDGALARLDAVVGRRVALLGPALDGGWWAIGLPHPVAGVFDGIPMSTSHTGAQQLARLCRLGWKVEQLPPLRDIDTITDLVAVAAALPGSRTAGIVAELGVASGLATPPQPARELVAG
jgi:glycosyltransferase A (GT-A) superfamily protein (DUF2064 family)